ncbi:hypothetical protein CLV63_101544 [Murinocardiopsis flavida]|uniref:Uncharacterized protein n=1 Tax=Murinocardiopsis flavida TaxID=645275 RepID=A0A2P8DV32_9ACTN|nr:hypothetical protein [Murinocardiopsis flavida]PSL01065.1 hypothetical protein CLV63_101544 [Murinocardiopsis flavida]
MPIDMSAPAPRQLNNHQRLILFVEGVRERAAQAVPWGPDTVGIPAQATDDALLHINDVAFYANARTEVAVFADLCLNLITLHRPRDSGGVGSGAAGVHRCNCCMLRWPCPTISEISTLLH